MLGNYNISLDEKGRLIIPKVYRKALGDSLVISLEFENSIVVRTKHEFDQWASLLLKKSYLNKHARLLQRKILGNSYEAKFDSKGRIQLSKSLINQSRIESNVYVIGTGNKLEIISASIWNKMMSDTEDYSLEEAAAELENVADTTNANNPKKENIN